MKFLRIANNMTLQKIINKIPSLPEEELRKAAMQVDMQLLAWNYANHDRPGSVPLAEILKFERLQEEFRKEYKKRGI